MPILDATTTSVFTSVFGSGGASTTQSGNLATVGGVYYFMQVLFSEALSVGIWLVEAIWPFLLVVGILVLFVAVASKMLHWHR